VQVTALLLMVFILKYLSHQIEHRYWANRTQVQRRVSFMIGTHQNIQSKVLV